MDYLPLSFNLQNKTVLLVGAGKVALRKARTLLKAQAKLKVVAPEIDPSFENELKSHFESKSINYIRKEFEGTDVTENVLVVAACNKKEVNKEVSQAAQALNIPVNVVDQPELSTVIFPSIVDRSPISIAISSSGKAPVLSRLLRARIESLIPSVYGDLAQLVDEHRNKVKKLLPNIEQRKAFWEKVLNSTISEHLLSNRKELASQRIEHLINELEENKQTNIYQGEVYLIGAGPGDPDLLTFKALRLLQQADVVLYDRLVSDEIIDLARKDAERIYVGKTSKEHTIPQEGINELLVRLAKEGKRVCRLKGGDPFIFGRGGEELENLRDAQIDFQVVPGITAASGCASYAGIPLTHRDYSQSVIFVTGHRQKDPKRELNWQALAAGDQTLVFYMGLAELENISKKLVKSGLSETTPAALIQQGTTKNQLVIESDLKNLPQKVLEQKVKAPTLVIIGEVVRLREKLDWFGANI
jgi:uroporphyrin-III C-methyltransferase/precorrin-2 dehydrogenase/sirohydrochlorin ferrochelatase